MKKIKVGGLTYTIVFAKDHRVVNQDRREAKSLLGQTDYFSRTLNILESPLEGEQELTFYHELCHAIIEGYHLKQPLQDDDGVHNEAMVDVLAIGLKEALNSLGINIIEKIKGRRDKAS